MGFLDFWFTVTVGDVTAHQFCKVYLVAIELGTIHTGELGLAAHGNTAAAAHTGAVDHDGVQGNHGLDAEGLGGLADKLHHGDRSNGQNGIIVAAGLQQLLQLHSDEALLAVGAVVGHQVHIVSGSLEFILQNDNVLIAETDHNVDFGTGFFEGHGRGQSDGAANAAAHHTNALDAFRMGGLTQRADEVADVVAFIQVTQGDGGETYFLENDGYSTGFTVVTGNGQGNALAHFIDAENDELAGLSFFCYEGCFDLHQGDRGVQLLLTHDFIHDLIRPFQNLIIVGSTAYPYEFIIKRISGFVKYLSIFLLRFHKYFLSVSNC